MKKWLIDMSKSQPGLKASFAKMAKPFSADFQSDDTILAI